MKKPAAHSYLSDFASRLRALLEPYKSFRAASEALDIPEPTLTRLARGANDPGSETLLKLATKLNVSLSYLLGVDDDPAPPRAPGAKRPADMDMANVPNLDARAAAGAGSINHIVAIERILPFPIWMLHKLASPGAKVSFMRAAGDSMLPLFGDGALLLVNESDADLPARRPRQRNEHDHRDIYVFLHGDDQRVKRLRRKDTGEIVVISENRAYDPEILRGPDLKRFKIVGRVIWWDDRL